MRNAKFHCANGVLPEIGHAHLRLPILISDFAYLALEHPSGPDAPTLNLKVYIT